MREWFPCPKKKQFNKICWDVCRHNNCPNLDIDLLEGYRCKFKSTIQKKAQKKKKRREEENYSVPV
jgi:hypothetical protein